MCAEGAMHQCSGSVKAFEKFAQRQVCSPEAGGILLGRMMEISSDLIIDEVTTPGTKDKQRRYSFFRSRRPAQQIVNKAWMDSRGAVNYLGEWHTHPEMVPQPSFTDRCNWKRIVRRAHYEVPSLLFVIVGTHAIRVWEVSRTGGAATLLASC